MEAKSANTLSLEEGRLQFIELWGKLGSAWGITRTMAQIHALLLMATRPMNADEIMAALQISRGNVNMNLRGLIDWGLVYKSLKPGERKEFFTAEKDIAQVIKCIIAERKKRELEPLIKALTPLSDIKGDDADTIEFKNTIENIQRFSQKADSTLERLSKADSNWLINGFLNMIH